MNSGNLLRSSPSRLKTMLASRFTESLRRINRYKKTSTSTSIASSSIIKRSKRIKLAAYASMAYSAGSMRVWSRELLRKLRRRARLRGSIAPKVVAIRRSNQIHLNGGKASESRNGMVEGAQQLSRSDKLRRLVPGGKAMDFCTLLDETADYIQFLATQVQVMQGIADSLAL